MTTEPTDCAASLEFDSAALAGRLFGPQNINLNLLSERSGVKFSGRGGSVVLSGPPQSCTLAGNLLTQLYDLLKSGTEVLHPEDVGRSWDALLREPGTDLKKLFREAVFVASPRKVITPKTLNQRDYVEALRNSDMTFGVGPAGTGKTYLAVAAALSMLLAKRVKRLILTRPAVEAGERLGFLPGDMAQKVDPYLRPLYDALHDMLDAEKVADMSASNVIEVAPLAFMRGRTLNDAFIILDEAQNTTPEQMKMFLTRLGFGSKAVITGDLTQTDLPDQGGKRRSGLAEALEILRDVPGISIRYFDQTDVVRHPLVGRIVHAYDTYQKHSR